MSGSPSAFLNFMTFSFSHTIKLKSEKNYNLYGDEILFFGAGRRNILDAKSSKNLLQPSSYGAPLLMHCTILIISYVKEINQRTILPWHAC
jgi:hypothetical protein